MIQTKTFFIIGMATIISLQSFAGGPSCKQVFNRAPRVALMHEELPPEIAKDLSEMIDRDPDLQSFLNNPNFVLFMKGLGEGRSLDELRPYLFEIWKNTDLADNYLGQKTGALLIGPNANNSSKLVEIIKNLNIQGDRSLTQKDKPSNFKFLVERMSTQIRGLKKSLSKSKNLIETEMNPASLDANLFDFYGYLNLKLDSSRLREWKTPENSFQGIKLGDVKDMDPIAFSKVLMLASQIEEPISAYSDASGEIFKLYPQATRFMGKTQEQAEYHRKARKKLYCTNSWCEEENRHEGLLENLARRITGTVLNNTRPFDADRSLSPFRPEDVNFHVMARANNELAASSTYFLLGSHAEGNVADYLSNIRGDEVKHSTIFAGLYHYLKGDTYWTRLKGVIKKTLIELADKNENSEYASVLKAEPVMMIEGLYAQIKYERKIKQYISLLPLKTLRKFFETEINLDPLPGVESDPAHKAQVDHLSKIEKARRESLANWPQAQREAAYKLEYFEADYNDQISKIIAKKFAYFKGAEDFGSKTDVAIRDQIEKLNAGALSDLKIEAMNSSQLALLKTSLKATLRDYQIMNNRNVRRWGLHVQFIDAVNGFEIVKDEALQKLKKVESNKSQLTQLELTTPANVIGVYQETATTLRVRLQKPKDFVFKAGQAVQVSLPTATGLESRVLSIASSPQHEYLDFAMRATDSFFKEAISKLQVGEQVTLGLPQGGLKINADAPAVMIAGGIGITPFRSLMQEAAEKGTKTPMTLIYSNKANDEIAFKNELVALTQKNSNLAVDFVAGRIEIDYLQSLVKSVPNNSIFYIVAPLPMVQSMKALLKQVGVSAERVVVESFPGYR